MLFTLQFMWFSSTNTLMEIKNATKPKCQISTANHYCLAHFKKTSREFAIDSVHTCQLNVFDNSFEVGLQKGNVTLVKTGVQTVSSTMS